jgi:hypothetical protein
MRSLSSKQQGPRDILTNKHDNESSDDESSDDELLSVKDILEEFLRSKPEVIDLTFDSEFEASRPSPIKATRLLRGLAD